MHRFKASKYKNSVAKCSKKENSFTDIFVETPLCSGNHLTIGGKYIACNIGSAGSGKVGIFGINETGRAGQQPSLAAHGDSVTDIEFSPFYHNVLLTASEDLTVNLWKIPSGGLSSSSVISAVDTYSEFRKRPEILRHHPVANNVLAVASGNVIQIWNIDDGTSVIEKEVGSDLIQSISWKEDGKIIACTNKDKTLSILDPRARTIIHEGKAHDNHKDSRVLCLGNTGKIVTTGYSTSRMRQLRAWDERNMSSCLQTMEFGSSTSILMPFFDPDTNMIFLSGKGDSSLNILEASNGSECITQASNMMLPDQTKGMGLAPKIIVDVMGCEVNRLYQLCSRQIVPIRIEVPRRSHSEFASELYPDTDSDDIVLSSEAWFEGKDGKRLKTSLDPSRKKPLRSDETEVVVKKSSKETVKKTKEEVTSVDETASNIEHPKQQQATKAENHRQSKPPTEPSVQTKVNTKPFAGVRQCKFRHWFGTVLHPSTHITGITKLSTTIAGSCDGFHVNDNFAAIPLSTPGGHVGIVELSKVGRVTSNLPSFQNTSAVTDFKWNPFDNRQLAVALDDGLVKLWQVPKSGFQGTISEPKDVLRGHYSKVICIDYHPLASNILATASFDMNVIIWNVECNQIVIELSGHSEEILAMKWSTDGKHLATVSKDNMIRVYDPRSSTSPVKEGPAPKGNRGARILWVCKNTMLFVSGFSSQGTRSVSLYSVDDMEGGPLVAEELDNSPATLVPFYDEGSGTVFLTGKGDTALQSFEISKEDPYLSYLTSFKSDHIHQGLSFMAKKKCNPRKVEFAKAWRLSKASLEPISFKVPRVKIEYFQDDLFPDMWETNVATMSAEEWLDGKNKMPALISLRPPDMKPLSKVPKEAPKKQKYESYNVATYKTDEEKKEELLTAMSSKLDLDKQLEQDTMEGVDEDEWDDY